MFNVLYDSFKKLADDPQEPIDLEPLADLLKNEIEMISHKRFFNQRQLDIIVPCAFNEAKFLLLPSVETMSLEELERAWRVRGVVLITLNDPSMQELLANCLPPNIPNQRKFYDCLVFLIRDLRFALKCQDEIIKRIRSNPTTLNTHGLVEMGEEEMMQFCSDAQLDSQLASKAHEASYEYLRRELLQKTWSIISDRSERESLINEALGKRYDELRKMPFYKRISNFEHTEIAVKRDLLDYLKEQHRQKRYPEGGFVSIDEDVVNADGNRGPMLELLEDKYPAVELNFTDEKRKQLDEAIGKKARIFLELFYLGYSDKEIADMMGYKNQSPISKHRRKVKENYDLIKEIMLE